MTLPSNVLWKKAIIDRSHDTDLALGCSTDTDLSDIDGEIEEMEESNVDVSDGGADESDYDQGDANTVIGRDSCAMWHKEHPRTRRNVRQNVPREIAGVHVAVPTHSVSATFSFFITDEMQEHAMQATNHELISQYGQNWKIVDNIELMSWIGFLSELGWTRIAIGLLINYLAWRQAHQFVAPM